MERNVTESIDPHVQSFLEHGTVNGIAEAELAHACDVHIRQLAQKSLTDAKSTAERLVKQATPHGNPLLLTAYRTLARTTHMSGQHAPAEHAYLHARRLAGRDKQVIGAIDRALIDVYMYLNDFSNSRKCARRALKIFEELRSDSDIAMTQVNYGNLLHRQDRHREAETLYRDAAQFFDKAGNELAVARCLYNRANTLVQLFDFDRAEKQYTRSEEIYARNSFDLDATDARYGLAWMHMLQGRFHVALHELAECEEKYHKASHRRGVALCVLDRAEVLLSLNLYEDALISAKSARESFAELGLRYESAKADLFTARASFALNNHEESARSLKRARAGFEAEQNKGFLGASLLLQAQTATRRDHRQNYLQKSRKQFSLSQLPLWRALCDIFLAEVSQRPTYALERLAKNKAVRNVPHLFASWQTLLGDRAHRSGDFARARRHWRRAADRLDAVRAQLPPVELRSHFGDKERSPHRRLVESEMTKRPNHAAAWSERYKTIGVWAPLHPLAGDPVRARAADSLSRLAEQVAALSVQLHSSASERSTIGADSHKNIARLQRDVRRKLAAMEKPDAHTDHSLEFIFDLIKKTSARQPVIQFHVGRSDIVAFIHERGNTRTVTYPGGHERLGQFMRQWRFLLESASLASVAPTSASLQSESEFFARFGEWLWRPLEIPENQRRVLIIPEGELANLPWLALRINGRELVQYHQLTLAPSLRHHHHALGIRVRSKVVELFAGPSDDLPAVKQEVDLLQEKAGNSVRLHDPCYRSSWPARGSAKIWHFTGHARLRTDNPFYSYLMLQDGPLFAADFRLRNFKLHLATLAACRSGENVSLPGEESTGLLRSLLEMGARNVLAGLWPVSDEATGLWMHQFYREYFDGKRLLEATQSAALKVKEKFPRAYHWAAFGLFGAGD